MFSIWCVWLPVVCCVYSLPGALQVALLNLALVFWVLVLALAGKQKADDAEAPRVSDAERVDASLDVRASRDAMAAAVE